MRIVTVCDGKRPNLNLFMMKDPVAGTSEQNLSPSANLEDEDEMMFVSLKPGKFK